MARKREALEQLMKEKAAQNNQLYEERIRNYSVKLPEGYHAVALDEAKDMWNYFPNRKVKLDDYFGVEVREVVDTTDSSDEEEVEGGASDHEEEDGSDDEEEEGGEESTPQKLVRDFSLPFSPTEDQDIYSCFKKIPKWLQISNYSNERIFKFGKILKEAYHKHKFFVIFSSSSTSVNVTRGLNDNVFWRQQESL